MRDKNVSCNEDFKVKQYTVSRDRLQPLCKGSCRINGYLGKRIDGCIENGIMATDYSLFVAPFKEKTDDGGDWGGEFFGKWYTSAALAYYYRPEERYKDIIEASIAALRDTQEENGRLSACKNDFASWDLWGRKYALLSILAHYEQTGDRSSLDAAAKSVDNIIEIAGRGKRKVTETGLKALEALSSCSIMEPVALLYKYTGTRKYLDFAEYMAELWSLPNSYTDKGIRLVEDALDNKEPIYISAPKSYEMMSCYEGLCVLYSVTGKRKYIDAALNFAKHVAEKEIMIVGSGSSSELWCDGAMRQTELLEHPIETCVTATWMKLCYKLLCITGDPFWADHMEVTLYNSLLSALVPDGSWWAYYSPLSGVRQKSHIQMPYVNSSCCVVNGPRGLLEVPKWAVMSDEDGLTVNLFSEGVYSHIISGTNIRLELSAEYPKNGLIGIKIYCDRPQAFAIRLRIPRWSEDTGLFINAERVECRAGSYACINREFKNGDEIELRLDMRGRVITSPGNINCKAIMTGPIVLAFDNRLVQEGFDRLWLDDGSFREKYAEQWDTTYYLLSSTNNETRYVDIRPCRKKPENIWLAYEVPFISRPTHFFKHRKVNVVMCDYSSAGNAFCDTNIYSVWLPQPTFMNAIFPKKTEKNSTRSL